MTPLFALLIAGATLAEPPLPARKPMIGLRTGETPINREYEGKPGVYVRGVARGGGAEAAGLREGDLVERVDGRVVTSPEQVVEAVVNFLKSHPPEACVPMRVRLDYGQAAPTPICAGQSEVPASASGLIGAVPKRVVHISFATEAWLPAQGGLPRDFMLDLRFASSQAILNRLQTVVAGLDRVCWEPMDREPGSEEGSCSTTLDFSLVQAGRSVTFWGPENVERRYFTHHDLAEIEILAVGFTRHVAGPGGAPVPPSEEGETEISLASRDQFDVRTVAIGDTIGREGWTVTGWKCARGLVGSEVYLSRGREVRVLRTIAREPDSRAATVRP
ncbi:MAG: PDZ domain-containing protein [Deltaproteobacteria bacterium]|nr:PDZ domain-containing protein [Deltaproteobacteria bacterium]